MTFQEQNINRVDTNIIIDNQYFANINCINALFKSTHINIFSFEAYRKMSFRNRCVVAGSNGLINLSVPVQSGRDQKSVFKDVRISYTDGWQKQQWVTLISCYNKSAFFEFYRDGLEKFFQKKEVFLFDLDLAVLHWLQKVLGFKAEIKVWESGPEIEELAQMTDLRDRWLPKNFQRPELQNFTSRYFQVFENRLGFQPNLSVLDLLFNEGPNAATLLINSIM